jgi:hypothetical protein
VLDEDDLAVEAGSIEVRLELRVVGCRDEDDVLADVEADVVGDAGALLVDVEPVDDAVDVRQRDLALAVGDHRDAFGGEDEPAVLPLGVREVLALRDRL